jgi:NADPH2:quinone reductase
MAKLIGAHVITTVGSADKAEIARACGADHVIQYEDIDFRDEVMRITEGRGVDVAYDSVGKDTIDRSIRSVRRRGLCVMFGASSGQVAGIAPLALAEAGSVYFTRPHLADYIADAEELNGRARSIFESIGNGSLRIPIFQTYALEDARLAHLTLESRGTRGKLLLQVRS